MKYYTIYLSQTDELIASGTSRECAKQLNLTIESFYCAVGRARSGKRKKYIVIEELISENKEID